MRLVKLAFWAGVLMFGTAVADGEIERKMELKVVVAGNGPTTHWSSDKMDFDLDELAVGETRSIDGDSGRAVTVTRGEDGYTFDIDGQIVEMPDIGSHGTRMAFVSADGVDQDFDIEVMGDGHTMMGTHPTDGVTIISSQPLDSSVRESIKSVLVSAGNNDEVTFIDGSENGKHVMMMKRVKITE